MSENGDDHGTNAPNLVTAAVHEDSRPQSQEMNKNEDIASCHSRLLARQMINPKLSNIPKLDLKSHRLERERADHNKSRESKVECPSQNKDIQGLMQQTRRSSQEMEKRTMSTMQGM